MGQTPCRVGLPIGLDCGFLNSQTEGNPMNEPSDIQFDIVNIEFKNIVIGNPPQPYTAVQLTLGDRLGNRKAQDWMGFPPALAQRLMEHLQNALGQGQGQPLPQGPLLH